MTAAPRIVVTVAASADRPDADVVARKNQLYADAIQRHGGEAVLLDATSSAREREAAFATIDGLLLSGGVDMDPARYGQPNRGSVDVQPDRDELELEAWAAGADRNVPVLGICRGFQVLNVILGGTLLQDVGGHAGPGWGRGPALRHPLRVAGGTRLARMLFPRNVGGGVVQVNSYHHQAVRPTDVAPGLIPNAFAASPTGELVEGIESRGTARLLLAVQCHPERTESTPPAFERLWSVFVDACRGPATSRDGGRTSTSTSTSTSTTVGRPG
jgi:putative glutamine amidotransferase